MKRTIIILAIVCVFILGMVLSEFIFQGFNAIFGDEVFTTKHDLEQKLSQKQMEMDKIIADQQQREKSLDQLVKDLNNKDYFALTKEELLTPATAGDENTSAILLKPSLSEMYLQPSGDEDPAIKEVKEGFNSKLKVIMGVSKGILREKIVKLNLEVVKMNNILKAKNQELNQNLAELQEYKSELEKYRTYITELEGIRSDLERTVGDLETKIEGNRLKVSFKGDILFPSGSHQLRAEGIKLLESVFPVLEKNADKYDIFIAGHTDNVPIKQEARGKYASNWELSTYRAIEVVKYLTQKGMNPQDLTAAGYGEYKPVADNTTEVGKSRNRRVELFLIPNIIRRIDE